MVLLYQKSGKIPIGKTTILSIGFLAFCIKKCAFVLAMFTNELRAF